eukprot:874449-Ditylum_brightwellii.AAC.1
MTKLTHADDGDHHLAERLDKILIQACLLTKKKCKQCHSEWWSLLLIQARSMVHILKVHLAKLKCNANIDLKVTKFSITIKCPDNMPDRQKDLKKSVKNIIAQSAEKRREHNKKVAEIHALTGDTTAEHAMKAIINSEDMSNMSKKIAYADKGKRDNNLTSISILAPWPDMNTTIMADCELEDPQKAEQWCTVELPEEILHYLIVQN